MNTKLFFRILKYKWQSLALFVVVLLLLTVAISLLQPFKYEAEVGLLVIQKQNLNMDAYASSRAAESLALNITQIIKTDSFFKKVQDSGFAVTNDWHVDDAKRRQEWQKTVTAIVAPESGLLRISVYHTNKEQAKEIAKAVATVLTNQGQEYYGLGDAISIKLVDTPLVSKYPVKPNLPLNIGLALVLGVCVSLGYVWYISSVHLWRVEEEQEEDDIVAQNDLVKSFKEEVYEEAEDGN